MLILQLVAQPPACSLSWAQTQLASPHYHVLVLFVSAPCKQKLGRAFLHEAVLSLYLEAAWSVVLGAANDSLQQERKRLISLLVPDLDSRDLSINPLSR